MKPDISAQRHYLLVEVDDGSLEQLMADLAGYPGVGDVTGDHGKGCCCKNCPWKGDHQYA